MLGRRVGSSQRMMAVFERERRHNITAFRLLYRTTLRCARGCGVDEAALLSYVRGRLRGVSENNKRVALAGAWPDAEGKKERHIKVGRSASPTARLTEPRSIAYFAAQRRLLAAYASALSEAPKKPELGAILSSLASGVGNLVYQRTLEKGYFDLVLHSAASERRGAADAAATEARQNRLMQAALLPLVERLQLLYGDIDPDTGLLYQRLDANTEDTWTAIWREAPLSALTPEALRHAFGTTRTGVTVHALAHGADVAVVEIDEGLNRQIIYLRCSEEDLDKAAFKLRRTDIRRELGLNADPDSNAELLEDIASAEDEERYSRIEVASNDRVRGMIAHATYNSIAARLFEALTAETPLHRSRGTVVVGHGAAGAVAALVGLQLHCSGFPVKNVISCGSPRCLQSVYFKYVNAINPIRIVASGDPRSAMLLTSSEGRPLEHIGEVLTLTPRETLNTAQGQEQGNIKGEGGSKKPELASCRYNIADYVMLLRDPTVSLSYAEYE